MKKYQVLSLIPQSSKGVKKYLFLVSIILFAALSAVASPISVQVGTLEPKLTVSSDLMFAADLAIWNSPTRYQELKPAIIEGGFTFFRFPNGSLSNDYHWNGSGSYDSTGVWTASDSSWSSGFLGETKYRGTTKDNWGFIRRSHLADGDTSTIWWGAVYDQNDPPWLVIELPEMASIDSLIIHWGKHAPSKFEWSYWTKEYAPYPGVHQALENHLKVHSQESVNSSISQVRSAIQSRYFAIRFKASDLPSEGVQIKEMALYSQGSNLLMNPKTKLFAMSTRYGDFARTDWTGIKWDFKEFMDYIQKIPGSEAVICVNAGTGTAKEAADWVRYANHVKKYNIKNWQVGNELDGEWEESGPLSARHYAARFLEFARAMKAVDSTILLHGPLFSSFLMRQKGAGFLDGRFWMAEFLRIVGEVEKKEGRRYLDVVDMHTYPYWTPKGLNAKDMMNASRFVGPNLDTLSAWMGLYLEGKRRVHLSEFSSTVQGTSILMEPVQAAAVANIAAQFVERFGDRLHLLPWDTYGGMHQGPDSTFGTMSLSILKRDGAFSSWGALEPTTEYYGIYMTYMRWIRDGWSVLPTTSSDSSIAAYTLVRGDSSRVLLINFTGTDQEVKVDHHSKKSVRIQAEVFGNDQYKWIGTSEKAYSSPGMGPSGRRLKNGTSAELKVPAFGLAVVHFAPALEKKNAPGLLHALMVKKVLLASDTLELWGTVYQKDGQLTYGKITIRELGVSQKILPEDGAWNAAVESFHVKIPIPANVKLGEKNVFLEVMGLGGKTSSWKWPFKIRGKYRTIGIMENFDAGLDSVSWFPVANGDNKTEINAKVFPGGPPNGGYIRHDFFIEQPPTQTWPNFAGAHYPAPEEVKKSVGVVFDYATTHDNPKGYHEVLFLSNQVKDYDEFMFRLKNTRGAWVRDTVIWSDISQEGWGKMIPELDPTQIRDFAFRGRFEGKGYISIDNIYFLGESGEEVKMPLGLRRLR